MFAVTDFSEAEERLCADHPHANVFFKTAVRKLGMEWNGMDIVLPGH